MSDTQEALEDPKKRKRKRLAPSVWWSRELFSAILWGLILVKLFIYDFDVAIVNKYAPEFIYLLKYRFFAILGLIAVLWLVLGKRRFRSFVAYVLIYPLVVILWRIPKHILRNWAVIIAFSPAIHSIITTFRWTFITGTAALIAALIITISATPLILLLSMSFLFLYLGRHFFHRFRMAFQPSTVFADIAQLIRRVWAQVNSSDFLTKLNAQTKHEPGTEEYEKGRLQNLLSLYIFNSVLQFFATKAHQVATSTPTHLL